MNASFANVESLLRKQVPRQMDDVEIVDQDAEHVDALSAYYADGLRSQQDREVVFWYELNGQCFH